MLDSSTAFFDLLGLLFEDIIRSIALEGNNIVGYITRISFTIILTLYRCYYLQEGMFMYRVFFIKYKKDKKKKKRKYDFFWALFKPFPSKLGGGLFTVMIWESFFEIQLVTCCLANSCSWQTRQHHNKVKRRKRKSAACINNNFDSIKA